MGFDTLFQISIILLFLLFVFLVLIASVGFFFYLEVKWVILPLLYYYRGRKAIYSDSSSDKSKEHIAIIVIIYKFKSYGPLFFLKNIFVYCSGVELLKEGFEEQHKPYIIYRCSSPKDVKEVIKIKEADKVWIIGHGFKHGISFGKERLYYCDLEKCYKKSYIMQLHCNEYGGRSLIDYLCETKESKEKSFVCDCTRDFYENREFIQKILEKMRKKEF